MKHFVHAEWLESFNNLGFMHDVSLYEDLSGDQLKNYLTKKVE